MKSNKNSGLVVGLLIGAAIGATAGLFLSGDKGKKVIKDIRDAAGKAENELKKAYSRFEEKLSKGKEAAQNLEKKIAENLEKKASRFMKQKTT